MTNLHVFDGFGDFRHFWIGFGCILTLDWYFLEPSRFHFLNQHIQISTEPYFHGNRKTLRTFHFFMVLAI